MRNGLSIKTKHLSALMRRARMNAGISMETAAWLIGFRHRQSLQHCELGNKTFPIEKVIRACGVYGIKQEDCIEAFMKDTKDAITKFLKEAS
jgi:hypothetical protein